MKMHLKGLFKSRLTKYIGLNEEQMDFSVSNLTLSMSLLNLLLKSILFYIEERLKSTIAKIYV